MQANEGIDQLLRVYQRTVAAAVLAVGYWLILLFAIADEPQLGFDMFFTGIFFCMPLFRPV